MILVAEWSTDEVGRLAYRSPELVEALISVASELAEVGYVALVARVGEESDDRWAWKTIEGAIRDLVWMGAFRVVGTARRGRPDDRVVHLTMLGERWATETFG